MIAVVAVLLALNLVVGPSLGFQVARIEGEAMAPTLNNQDRLVVNQWAYTSSTPKRGDIVMLRYPLDTSKRFVKRVVAVGGDTLRIEDGRVVVNEVALDDGYVAADARGHDSFGPRVVADGHYFVMGDRRNNSSDSRHWGEVREDLILGRVALRWFPTFDRPR